MVSITSLSGLTLGSSYNSSSSSNTFTPITIGASLLTATYSAQLAQSTANTAGSNTTSGSSSSSSSTTANKKNAVTPPWELGTKAQSVASAYVEAKDLTNFVDVNATSVQNANGNADYKELFALFNGMSSLMSLAQYAAQDTVPSAVLGSINTQFQKGLSQISDFMSSYSPDKLTMLFGQKSDQAQTAATLGEDSASYVGRPIEVANKDTVVPGLTGTEQFTVTMTKGSTSENFLIDLSKISGPLTMQNIVNYINQQIHAPQATDTNGNPVFDDNGNPVPKYTSYFTTDSSAGTGLTSLKVIPSIVEKVSLSAAGATPSVYVTGTSTPLTGGDQAGFLTKLDNVDGSTPTSAFNTSISGLAPGQVGTATDSSTSSSSTSSSSSTDPNAAVKADIPTGPKLAQTTTSSTATDSQGNVYVLGSTAGDLGSEINRSANSQDVYLSKYDSTGQLIWQRLVGATTESNPGAITVDASDNVIIAGSTPDNLTPSAVIDSVDSFVSKYSSGGEELWTQQVNAVAADRATSLTTDASGNVYFGGYVSGAIDASATNAGNADSYVIKLSGSDGSQSDATQFGTAGLDRAGGLAVASDGNVVVAGIENGHAVVRKLDATNLSNTLWTVDLGDTQGGNVAGVKVGSDGSIYVGGTTSTGGLAGTTLNGYSGGKDGFVAKIADSGGSASASWTNYVGTSSTDSVTGLDVGGGSVYLTGSTDGTLPGQTQFGATDSFAAALDASTGSTQWIKQFGRSSTGSSATGIAYTGQGSSVLSVLGLPSGTVNGNQDRSVLSQTSLREGDYFYVSVNGGNKVKISIDKGDTFTSLALKVKRASFLYVDSYNMSTSTGPSLVIKALRGASIDIIPGDGTHDALKGLGLEATKLKSDATLTGDSPSSSSSSSSSSTRSSSSTNPSDYIFGLGLSDLLNLNSHDAAKQALAAITKAIGSIQSAYRQLNPDPTVEALKNKKAASGPVPTYLQNQIANYQAGLTRLTA